MCQLCNLFHEWCLRNAFFTSLWFIWAKFTSLRSLWFERCLSACPFLCVLPAPPFLLIGVPSGLNLQQSWVLCDLYGPPCFLHSVHCLSLKPTCLGFLGMWESMGSILHLPSDPFCLITLGGLASTSALFLIFSKINRRALALIGVIFSVKLYWVCQLAGHLHSKCVARLALSKDSFVAWFALGL